MRRLTLPPHYSNLFVQVFSETQCIADAEHALQKLYNKIGEDYPYFHPFSIKLVSLRKVLLDLLLDTSVVSASENAIVISNTDYEVYLWLDNGQWTLEEDFFGPQEIAKQLLDCQIFNQFPETVKDLKKQLDCNQWILSPNLPEFDGKAPKDLDEVISWDKDNVLVGIDKDKLNVLTRQEWQGLCDGEKFWE